MTRKSFVLMVAGIMVFFLCSVSSGVVPDKINYQGKLTTAGGSCVNDTVSMTFTIYSDDQGTVVDWTEDQDSVIVKEGIFNVLLGSVNPIPASVFDGSTKYLGVQVESDPEMRPLKPMVSVGYAFRSAESDTAQYAFSAFPDGDWETDTSGLNIYRLTGNVGIGSAIPPEYKLDVGGTAQITGFKMPTDPADGYVLTSDGAGVGTWKPTSGGIQCEDCDDRFVNVQGSDSVIADSGIAFLGKVVGSSGSPVYGIKGYADNTSTGSAYGGFFETSYYGTGSHYGIYGRAYGSSSGGSVGSFGSASNSSTGPAVGGSFQASSSGTGWAYGVTAYASGFSSSQVRGFSGYASSSAGTAYGGNFHTSSGTGVAMGVYASASCSSSSSAYGSYGYASNTSSGAASGGLFYTSVDGSGTHYGVRAQASGSSSEPTYGCRGSAYNNSTGNVYGGFFSASQTPGTGTNYGVWAESQASSSALTFGCRSWASNAGTGSVYAGYFTASTSGTGQKYGVYASADPAQGYAGYFAGDVTITDSLTVLGTKSVAVKVDNGEYRLLYCQESSENWFEDFGEGQLVNGNTVVNLDPVFSQTVNANITYHVFLTPGGDCNGLYVANKTPTSFEVGELKGGNSSVTFSYRIAVKRKGYENVRLAIMGGPTPEEVAAEQQRHRAEVEDERAKREQEREKMEEERTRMEQEGAQIDKESELR